MGLDMHLEKRKTGVSYREDKPFNIKVFVGDDSSYQELITHEIDLMIGNMRWRKANQIHGWFVDNIQGGEDDCKIYGVYEESLEELLELVDSILDVKNNDIAAAEKIALEKLPPTEGFFFGDNQIDDYYWLDLEETSEGLKKLLETNINIEIGDNVYLYDYYQYSSSW